MKQYRMSLWIENEGDIPDLYVHLQTNAVPSSYLLVVSALLLSRKGWARVVQVEVLVSEGQRTTWQTVCRHSLVSLCGSGELFLAIGEESFQ